jgi:hypothetical protein
MRLLLLNQFGAASGAPTGRILAELGAELEKRGHRVIVLTTSAGYGQPRRGRTRLLHEGLAHLLLGWRSLWCGRIDAVLSLTSPACLAVTAGVISRLHGAKHFHWAMDLYPEVGVRLGELKVGALVRFLRVLMRLAYRDAAQVVTLDEDMRDFLQTHYGVDSAILEPFPPEVSWPASAEKSNANQWLYSGNFGRAHEIEILLQVQKRLEDHGSAATLVLQGQGPQFQASRETASRLGLRQVQWRAPAPQEQLGASLLESDVLVVTRKVEMMGLLLPSKLMLAELSGRTILWIGDTTGKTARRLAAQGRHGVFSIGQVSEIADWLAALFQNQTPGATQPPRDPRTMRENIARQWENLLTGISR